MDKCVEYFGSYIAAKHFSITIFTVYLFEIFKYFLKLNRKGITTKKWQVNIYYSEKVMRLYYWLI